MGAWTLFCAGCGRRLRTERPEVARTRPCPSCGEPLAHAALRPPPPPPDPRGPHPVLAFLVPALIAAVVAWAAARRLRPTEPEPENDAPSPPAAVAVAPKAEPPRRRPPVPRVAPPVIAPSLPFRVEPVAPLAEIPPPPPEPPPPPVRRRSPGEPRQVKVGDEGGRTMVARVLAEGDNPVVVLPDGRLARADGLVDTDEPFRPLTVDQLRRQLLAGPFADYRAIKTEHYLVLTRGSSGFARDSADLLESLYRGLLDGFRRLGLPVHDAEFPLVAVIEPDEARFRARKAVDPDVRAYYEVGSNRIFLCEDAAADAPEVAARRRPQTVAHEGTHQVLQNIGVQPRLADWPPWLVEGLAEFCAPTARNGSRWAGWNQVNPFHMATIHELNDPVARQLRWEGLLPARAGDQESARPALEALVTSTHLIPTDYALAWALVHYLANKRPEVFTAFLRRLADRPPGEPFDPEAHLAEFRRAFGSDRRHPLGDRVARHLGTQSRFEPLPYYAVVFEQADPLGQVRRSVLVSQSPTFIRQWLESLYRPDGGAYVYRAWPCQTRARAVYFARQLEAGVPFP